MSLNPALLPFPARELELELLRRAIVNADIKIANHERTIAEMRIKQAARQRELARQTVRIESSPHARKS